MATTSARQFQRRDTAANWTAANSVLGPGEIGVETDTGQIKVGNNTTAWTQLDYFTNATLPVANATVFGGIKVGYGLGSDVDGTTYIIADTGRIGMYEWEGPVHSGTLPLGKAAANNDTLTLATEILVNAKEAVTESIKLAKLQTLDTGDMLILQGVDTPGARFRFKITGTPVSYSLSGLDWVGYPVTLADSYGSEFGNGETIVVEGVPCNVSHAHNATTDITSGTVPTARLGSGTANASAVLFGNQTWAINRPASYTSGKFIDARDYGIVADSVTDVSDLVQEALDDLAADDDGGTLYFPACSPNNFYLLNKPVFFNGDRLRILGDGMNETFFKCPNSPAFVVGREPKNWTCSRSTYVDTDTSGTVDTNSGGKFVLNDGRYRVDRRHFTSQVGATYGAGASGNPVLEVVDSPGTFYGFRGRGVCKAVFDHNRAATGAGVYWESIRALTINVVYYAHDAKVYGGLIGCGGRLAPDPWILIGDGTNFELEFSVTDAQMLKFGSFRVRFAQPSALGLHRISIQINADAATVAEAITVWVNRVQVAYDLIKSRGESTVTESNVFVGDYKYFHPWKHADFTVGSQADYTSMVNESGTVTDYTIVGFAVFTSLQFNVSTVGSAQTRIDAATITDLNTAINTYGDNAIKNNAIACLAFETATGHQIRTWNGQGWDATGWGMIVPHGSVATITFPSISGIGITGNNVLMQNSAIVFGQHLSTYIDHVNHNVGHFASFGSLNLEICYTLHVTACVLYGEGSAISLKSHVIEASHILFGYVGRATIRASGSRVSLRSAITNTLTDYAEAFLVGYAGRTIAAGYTVTDTIVNFEGNDNAPRRGFMVVEKALYNAQNWFTVRSVTFDNNAAGTPNLVFLDPSPGVDQSWSTDIDVDGCQLAATAGVVVCGKDWRGSVRMMSANCADQVLTIIPTTIFGTGYSVDTNVKTRHEDFDGIPSWGGWESGMHEVRPSKVPDGGVVQWGVKTGGVMGSATPPVWEPKILAASSNIHALSGNVQATLYANVTGGLDHPDIATNVTLWGGHLKTTKTYAFFRHLFHGVTSFNRSYFQTAISKTHASISGGLDQPVSRSTATLNDSTLWPNASSGSKTNNTSIVMAKENPVTRNMLRGRSAFILLLGTDSGSMETVWHGRTDWVPGNFTNNCDLTIGAGNLVLGNTTRLGSWCHYMQNRILDWMFGYPSTTFPTTFYFGLSTTSIAADGTGGTEVSGGSYARQSLALNSTNFDSYDDHRVTWANKVAVTFPAPTADWGLCTYGFISDASSGGNILAKWPLNKPVRVYNGDPAPSYGVGAVQFQI